MPLIRNSKLTNTNIKYLSRSQMRKNKEKEEVLIKSQVGSLSKYFKKQVDSIVNEEQDDPISDNVNGEPEDDHLIETNIKEHDQANENGEDNEIVENNHNGKIVRNVSGCSH